MSAYELGYLVGALLMVALLAWVALSAFRRGTTGGRVVGALAVLLLVGSVGTSTRWFSRRQAGAERSFLADCLSGCRQELKTPGALCEEQCSCFAGKLRGRYTDEELAAWLEVDRDDGGASAARKREIEATIPICGRNVIGARFQEVCDEDCAKEGSCPAGFCRCMRDQLMNDSRFASYQWLSAVVLAGDETPQSRQWLKTAAAACVPVEGARPGSAAQGLQAESGSGYAPGGRPVTR